MSNLLLSIETTYWNVINGHTAILDSFIKVCIITLLNFGFHCTAMCIAMQSSCQHGRLQSCLCTGEDQHHLLPVLTDFTLWKRVPTLASGQPCLWNDQCPSYSFLQQWSPKCLSVPPHECAREVSSLGRLDHWWWDMCRMCEVLATCFSRWIVLVRVWIVLVRVWILLFGNGRTQLCLLLFTTI